MVIKDICILYATKFFKSIIVVAVYEKRSNLFPLEDVASWHNTRYVKYHSNARDDRIKALTKLIQTQLGVRISALCKNTG